MKTTSKYILNKAGVPVREPDLLKWARWFERANRHVGNTTVGPSRVSTVFLSLNHAFHGGPPILWETMVFGGKLDQETSRCSGSREQAEAMRARMVARVRRAQSKRKPTKRSPTRK